MKKALLNAWPSVISHGEEWQSVITLELTALPDKIEFEEVSGDADTSLERGSGNARGFAAVRDETWKPAYKYSFTLHGVGLVMAPDDILVADGLIKLVRIQPDNPAAPGSRRAHYPAQNPYSPWEAQPTKEYPVQVHVDVVTEYPLCELPNGKLVQIEQTPGLPATVTFRFSRRPLKELLRGVRIGIDPGHGGKDRGIRGPVDLTEKYVALEISLELCRMLEASGAHPVITRTEDEYLPEEERVKILRAGNPALCVEIHASGSDDPLAQVYRLAAKQGCEDSQLLLKEIALALRERMGITPESETLPPRSGLDIPCVRVEPVCLTYFADEANFRAPLFRKRLAQCIYNGVARYLHKLKTQAS